MQIISNYKVAAPGILALVPLEFLPIWIKSILLSSSPSMQLGATCVRHIFDSPDETLASINLIAASLSSLCTGTFCK